MGEKGRGGNIAAQSPTNAVMRVMVSSRSHTKARPGVHHKIVCEEIRLSNKEADEERPAPNRPLPLHQRPFPKVVPTFAP